MSGYLISIATIAGIYALLALALNLSWGLTGMINFGLSGLFAVGAYATAIATKTAGLPIPLGIALAVCLAAGSGIVLSLVTLRMRGDYLAIVTLGFAEFVRMIAANETWATGGTDGISNIPGPWRSSLSAEAFAWLSFALVTLAVVIAFVALERIRRLPLGRVLRAIRDDETVAAVAGKPVSLLKTKVFALVGAIAGLGGALYAHYTSFIAPDLIRPILTVYIFLALTAGGTGNNFGALLGGYGVVLLLESVRFLGPLFPGLDGARIGAVREIIVGVLLIVALRLRPQGLLPEPLTRAVTLRRRAGPG
jgi:branched-chain amino acid transport system permease protein